MLEEHVPIDFVYFNGGMQLLHLTKWGTSAQKIVMSLERILEDFLNTMKMSFQKHAPLGDDAHKSARLILMTNHNVCEQKFDGEFAEIIKKIESDEGFPCPAKHVDDFKPFAANDTELAAFVKACEASYFTHDGIVGINERMMKVAEPFALQNPGFLGIVDCYNLTLQKGCDFTSDGRHYPRLAAGELRVLLQQIDSRFPKGKERTP